MKVDRVIRVALALLILAVFIAGIGALLFVTDTAMNIWERLEDGPAVLAWFYIFLVFLLFVGTLWLIAMLLIPRRRKSRAAAPAVTQETLRERIEGAKNSGVEVAAAQAELARITDEQGTRSLSLVVFGEVSTGKSALIKAFLPDVDVQSSPIGGSTRELMAYRWNSSAQTQVSLIDMPGIEGLEQGLDQLARDEALRAHAVIFVCDSDLNRREHAALEKLSDFDKPVVVVLNKSDRYGLEEQQQLLERLHERTLAADFEQGVTVVPVTAGGTETLVERLSDGSEQTVTRQRSADIAQLIFALEDLLSGDPAVLALRREQAIVKLADEKLLLAESRYRQRRSDEIVRSYTKKAIIGGLAAVSPGSDIVIQGYLGTGMTRELCSLYGQSVRDMDVEKFLDLSQSRVGKAIPIALAVAGNGLKAFPGVGTVAGGVVHTVAYGLIFDALGRSLAQSLASGVGFRPADAAATFEESLQGNLEAGVKQVVKFALSGRRDND